MTKATDKPKTEDKAKDDTPKAKKAKTAPVATLPKGKGTQDDAPPASAPKPLERDVRRTKDDAPTEDTLRLQKDKARWTYGTNTDDTATMLSEQRQIERNLREQG